MVAFINHASYYDVFQKESQMSKPKLKKIPKSILKDIEDAEKSMKPKRSPKSARLPLKSKTLVPIGAQFPIGAQLASEREKLNLSVKDVAKRMKRLPSHVYAIERSKRSLQFDTIERYAKAIGLRAIVVFTQISKG